MNIRAARLATTLLAAACGALALVAIAEYAGAGRGYSWSDDAVADVGDVPGATIDKQPVQLPPASAFAAVETHPLFNEDREPTPVDATAGSEVPPPSPLNVALTGVILDEQNHVRVAMLQDKARNQPVALKVGMPLEGEQASWTLVEVKPRLVVFRNAANETAEVELETAAGPAPAMPRGGAKPAAAGRAAAPAANVRPPGGKAADKPADKPADASNDLARRIEERRRQMREDAERLRNGGGKKPNS